MLWLPLAPSDLDAWASSIVLSATDFESDDGAVLAEALGEFPEETHQERVAAMALVMASPAFQRQ